MTGKHQSSELVPETAKENMMSNIEGIYFRETPEQRRQHEAAQERRFRIGEIASIDWQKRRADEQVAIAELRRKIELG